jgi:hypothetical protein
MRLLLNYEQAIIDIEKLRGYCLSPRHPTGKNKARVFQRALGVNSGDAEALKRQILIQIGKKQVIDGKTDKYGKRFMVPIRIRNLDREAEVVTVWIIKKEENCPRLITCYVSNY